MAVELDDEACAPLALARVSELSTRRSVTG